MHIHIYNILYNYNILICIMHSYYFIPFSKLVFTAFVITILFFLLLGTVGSTNNIIVITSLMKI